MRQPTRIESRAMAIVLTALVVALVWWVLVEWWFVAPLRSVDGQIQSLRDDQQRYASVVAEHDALRERLASLSHSRIDAGAFLAGNDPNAATAGLMQHAVDVVTAHQDLGSCTVMQKMPVPASDAGHAPYRKVSASINMRCALAPLAAVLYELAHGTPYVFIDTFNVYGNAERSPDGAAALLNVQMTLSGYMHAHVGEVTQ